MRLPQLSRGERRFALLFLLSLPLLQPQLRGEGNGHYAWVASLAVDGDLDLENQYRRGDPDFVASTFRRADGQLWPTMQTPTGRARNQFSIGPALLWAPAFLEVHALVTLANDIGFTVAADGYSSPYRRACALTTASLGFAALLLAYRLALPLAGAPAAGLAALGVGLATSLPVYMYALPFYAHTLAAFAVALYLWFWRAISASWTPGRWAVWGATAGLMVQVDALTVSFLVVALGEWLRQAHRARSAPAGLGPGAAFALTGLLVQLPQLVAYAIVHGSPFNTGRFHRFFWDEPHLFAHAFGGDHGLFLWTPLILVALAGLAGLALRRDRFLGGCLLLASAAFFYVATCSDRWHTAPGFGNRFLIALTPVWVVGLATALGAVHRWLAPLLPAPRARSAAVVAGIALAVAWNVGLVFQWGSGLVSRREAVDFPRVVRQQFTLVPRQLGAFALRLLGARGAVAGAREPPGPPETRP